MFWSHRVVATQASGGAAVCTRPPLPGEKEQGLRQWYSLEISRERAKEAKIESLEQPSHPSPLRGTLFADVFQKVLPP
jgi:hypothetical protein